MCQNRTEWKITYGDSPNWPIIWKNSTKTSGDPGKAQYPMIRGLKMKEMASKNWKPKSAARAEAARKKKMLSDLRILKSRTNTLFKLGACCCCVPELCLIREASPCIYADCVDALGLV